MNIETFRDYCMSKPETSESFPFDETTLVFKVAGKMFALTGIDNMPLRVNLKCDPDEAIDLRERYPAVLPGYHMNKKLWNTVVIDGSIDESLIKKWIDDSYRLVIESMPKNVQNRLLGDDK